MSERSLENDIAEIIQLSKRTLDTVERFEKTLRGFMEYTQGKSAPTVSDPLSGLDERLKKEVNVSEDGSRYALKRFLKSEDWRAINDHLYELGFRWTKNGKEGYWTR
jgi:hypothetical protein